MNKKIKVAILYRVIQDWRLPVFEKLATNKNLSIKVFHGTDFKGTKLINAKRPYKLIDKALFTIKLRLSNNAAIMPINPTLFFHLIMFNPDVIICEGASNLVNDIAAFIYKKIFRKKFIWWSLGEIEDRKSSKLRNFLNPIIQKIEKDSDAIIVYSSFGKKYFAKQNIDEKKIFVAVNVIDTEKRLTEIGKLDKKKIYEDAHVISKFNILFVGALTKAKKIEILLKAYSRLEKILKKNVRLSIVGDGNWSDELKKVSENLQLQNVIFEGQVVEEVSRYFLQADVFVLPSLGGLAISDAMTHSLPIICGIADGCEKDLVDSTNGIIDKHLNEESLFKYLLELYSDDKLLAKMKYASLERIKNKHNINSYIETITECINYTINY